MDNDRTILVVDDEEPILKAIKRILRHEPYQVVTVVCPDDGLTLLEKGDIDVVISDLKMPRMTGLEFLKQVRARFPDVTRIILTGYADLSVAISAINEGEIFRFLTKPWEDDVLKSTIREALDQRLNMKDEDPQDLQKRKQKEILSRLESICPGITRVKRDDEGNMVLGDG